MQNVNVSALPMERPPLSATWRIRLFMAACLLPGLMLAAVTLLLWQATPAPLGAAIALRDYLNLWAAGTMARAGDFATLFHPAQYQAALEGLFGPAMPVRTWTYPPTMLALAIPLSFLPLGLGFLVWGLGTLGWLTAMLRLCRLPWLTCAAVVASPAVLEDFLVGQNGAWTAALLEGGLLLVDRRPVLAGVLFGLLTTKPHLGLLVPVCLVAAGRWRIIAAAIATTLAMVALSTAAFGASTWVWFLTDVRTFMTNAVLERPFEASFQSMMATPFILCRWLHLPLAAAYTVQGCVTAGCVGTAWWAWRRPVADPKLRMALTASLALLATPYGYSYDTIGTAVGVAVLAGAALQTRLLPLEAALLGAAWAWPGLAFWLGMGGMPPVGCLTLGGVAFCAWRRLRAG